MIKNILRNFLYLIVGQGLSGIISLITVIYLANKLGPENFGKYNFMLVVMNFCLIVSAFGTDFLGNREVAKDNNKTSEFVVNIVFVRLLASILTFSGLLLFIKFINKPPEVKALLLVSGISIFVSPFFLGWVFQGLQKMQFVALASLIRDLSFLLYSIFFVRPTNILDIGRGYTLSIFLFGFFFIINIFFNKIKIVFKLNKELLRKSFIDNFTLGYTSIIGVLIAGIDIFFISLMLGDEAAGRYGAAFRLIFYLEMIAIIYTNAIFPIMAKAWVNDMQQYVKLIGRSIAGIIAVFSPLVLITYVWGREIIGFIYREQYAGIHIILFILSIYLILNVLNSLFSKIFVIMQRNFVLSFIAISSLILNVSFMPLCIKYYGIVGAAYGKLFLDAIAVGLYFYFFRGYARRSFRSLITIK
jgi:PST family polysaccharide transporter